MLICYRKFRGLDLYSVASLSTGIVSLTVYMWEF